MKAAAQDHERKIIVVNVSLSELAVRICEANYGLLRPCSSAREALARMSPEMRAGAIRGAQAALDYLAEVGAEERMKH